MYYTPKDGHGLPHNPFSAIVAPRPIGWISSRSGKGHDNLAPYSFFNATAYDPPQLMFCSTGRKPDQTDSKDSVANIRETGVFAVNIVSFDLRDAMNASSAPLAAEEDEFAHAGLTKGECRSIDCAYVAEAPAVLECRLNKIVELEGVMNRMVLGEVTGVHLRDDCVSDGVFDVSTFQPLARLGYRDYAKVDNLFALKRPGD